MDFKKILLDLKGLETEEERLYGYFTALIEALTALKTLNGLTTIRVVPDGLFKVTVTFCNRELVLQYYAALNASGHPLGRLKGWSTTGPATIDVWWDIGGTPAGDWPLELIDKTPFVLANKQVPGMMAAALIHRLIKE